MKTFLLYLFITLFFLILVIFINNLMLLLNMTKEIDFFIHPIAIFIKLKSPTFLQGLYQKLNTNLVIPSVLRYIIIWSYKVLIRMSPFAGSSSSSSSATSPSSSPGARGAGYANYVRPQGTHSRGTSGMLPVTSATGAAPLGSPSSPCP